MTNRVPDTWLAVSLLLLGGAWTWLVIDTIPPGMGDGDIGPRAFPLAFGLMLIGLSALLLLRSLGRAAREHAGEPPADPTEPLAERPRILVAIGVLVQISAYGYLLTKLGFVLATPLIVLAIMVLTLRVRSIWKLAGMSLGLTLGCWVIFEKVLGIYLANGSWLNLG